MLKVVKIQFMSHVMWISQKQSETAVVISSKVFHTIACQKKYEKNYSTQKLTWKNDGKDGKDDKKHLSTSYLTGYRGRAISTNGENPGTE